MNGIASNGFRAIALSMVFIVLLFGSACKKESKNDGIASEPSSLGFPGCQLTNYGDYRVMYNTDGTIKSFGESLYSYKANSARIDIGSNEYFTFNLDSKKYPLTATYVDNTDSILLSYSYTSDGYLTKLEITEVIDGAPADFTEISNEYSNGNRIKSILKTNGEVISTSTYQYDLNKLDARKDFFERVFFNVDDPIELIPIFAGKASKNMLQSVITSETGSPSVVLTCAYTYDESGKVMTNQISEDGSPYASIFYTYLCK